MERGRNKFVEEFGRAYTLAIEMAIAVIVPVLIGRWLDSKTGKGPWFTLAGMILGGAAAMRSAYRAMTEMRDSQKKDEDSSGKRTGKED